MKKKIIILSIIFLIICISSVSASENSTDEINSNFRDDLNLSNENEITYNEFGGNSLNEFNINASNVLYVNKSCNVSGNGSSWENAKKNFNHDDVLKGMIIYLADGEYKSSLWGTSSCNLIGFGNNVKITYFDNPKTSYVHFNRTYFFINLTFICSFEDLSGADFNFINCTFINPSICISNYEHQLPNMDYITDVFPSWFKNCKFLNYKGDFMINAWGSAYVNFTNCIFENITADAIIDSYGAVTDRYGRFGGAYIYNSTFKKCNLSGVVKTRQLSFCKITNCSYDFDVNYKTPLASPFYLNTTDHPITKTKISIKEIPNGIIITFSDDKGNALEDFELLVVKNNKNSYEYTDKNGQIILKDLIGNYSFEVEYVGDDDHAFSSIKKNFTFQAPKITTKLITNGIVFVYNQDKLLTITLKDINNNLLNKKNIIIKIANHKYYFKTNSKGQAIFNISKLTPKIYKVIINFEGDNKYDKTSINTNIVVKKAIPKLIAVKKTFKVKVKTKKLTATLKDNKGKVLKNTKLTLKIKGKKYTAKTNKKGQATFKVKLNKKGTYKGTVKFVGNKYFKTIIKTVKIVAIK